MLISKITYLIGTRTLQASNKKCVGHLLLGGGGGSSQWAQVKTFVQKKPTFSKKIIFSPHNSSQIDKETDVHEDS